MKGYMNMAGGALWLKVLKNWKQLIFKSFIFTSVHNINWGNKFDFKSIKSLCFYSLSCLQGNYSPRFVL